MCKLSDVCCVWQHMWSITCLLLWTYLPWKRRHIHLNIRLECAKLQIRWIWLVPYLTWLKPDEAPSVWQSMWNITRTVLSTYLQQKLSHVDLNIEPWSCITAFTLDFTGSGFDIAQTRWCELYLIATTEYKAHRIFHISAIETEIRWFDYLGVIMQNCSCVGFDRTRVDIALIGWYWFNLQEMWNTRQIVLSTHFQQ